MADKHRAILVLLRRSATEPDTISYAISAIETRSLDTDFVKATTQRTLGHKIMFSLSGTTNQVLKDCATQAGLDAGIADWEMRLA